MSNVQSQGKKYNVFLRIGALLTLVSGSIWIGGMIIKMIAAVLPFALGLGILMTLYGLFLHTKKPQVSGE